MKVGDLVSTDDSSRGPIGVVVELTKRPHRTTAKVLVEGEVMKFDVEELWRFYDNC